MFSLLRGVCLALLLVVDFSLEQLEQQFSHLAFLLAFFFTCSLLSSSSLSSD